MVNDWEFGLRGSSPLPPLSDTLFLCPLLLQFSNVTFFIFGPLMMFLMHPYAQKRSRYIYSVSVLFMVVGRWESVTVGRRWWAGPPLDPLPLSPAAGLFSMYFHMTLSFLGQLLDEISILWLLASGYSIWMPRCYFPTFLGENRWGGGWAWPSGDPIGARLGAWVASLSTLGVLGIPPLTTPGISSDPA